VTKILGVHGVRTYQGTPDRALPLLSEVWTAALAKGMGTAEGFTLDLAYYAHRLRQETAQGEHAPELLPSGAQEMIIEWALQLRAPTMTAQGYPTVPIRDLIAWVARRFGLDNRLARSFVVAFFGEVHRYFCDEGRREAARADVAEAVERVRPKVLIAHSLGSVVAYETLWTTEHPPIELLVTLGSPLAMPNIVHDRLVAHPGERRKPPRVGRWVNIADPGDFIAVPAGGISDRFDGVDADLTQVIGAFAYHRVTKYLASPVVGRVLR
jgi:hypothetical protein